jgi:hypothetical protein
VSPAESSESNAHESEAHVGVGTALGGRLANVRKPRGDANAVCAAFAALFNSARFNSVRGGFGAAKERRARSSMSRIKRSVSSRLGTTNDRFRFGVSAVSVRGFAFVFVFTREATWSVSSFASSRFGASAPFSRVKTLARDAARSSARRARPASITRRVAAEKSSATETWEI